MYLYFSDYDLLDSFYTIYVSCISPETEYKAEQDRILSLYNEQDHTINSDSFKYESVVFNDILQTESEVVDYLSYSYVLFDRDESKIIYVMLFTKDDISKIDHVPSEYLPKEYLEFIQGGE